MAFYIVSFGGYFLLISNCITFRMKARYYFLLAGMIGAFIFGGIPLIGEISLVFVYAISAILDNVVGAIFSMFGINLQQHMWLYALIVWPAFVLISRFISGKIRQIRQRASVVFPLRITVVLAANVILCMLIFIVQVLFERMVGSSSTLLWGNVLLFAAYFALTFFMFYVFVKEYSKNAEMKVKQQSYENLRIYMAQIEELYQQLRGFKHDYANIMASMASYIETEDLEGLKTYYEREILPVSVKISRGNDAVVKLHNLNILELKSLLSLKLNYALELNIKVALEITEKIDQVEMKTLDLVRIMGIAREAGSRTKIAVASSDPRVDAVGSCVGVRGLRVRNITNELGGERIDIIPYDPDIRKYAVNALLPARVQSVEVDEAKHELTVRVTEEQSKLAFGKKAQNVRLCSKLIGWNISIRSEAPAREGKATIGEQIRQATTRLAGELGISEETAGVLIANGYVTVDGVREAGRETLLAVEGVDAAEINRAFDRIEA